MDQGLCLAGNQEPLEDLPFRAAALVKRQLRGRLDRVNPGRRREQILTGLSHPFPIRGKERGIGLASSEFIRKVAGASYV
ncbi:MAG TPA: hypothetical protein VG056_13885, partial [Pirellulales bacterium]|nr:hypothetical protein [Pirellulales bacterium]